MKKFLAFLTVVTCMLFFAQLASANLVTNGGFETGDFTGWTTVPAISGSYFWVASGQGPPQAVPHSGSAEATFAALGFTDDTISQIISTTPGMNYIIDFWLLHYQTSNGTQNDFHVYWNGSSVLNLLNTNPFAYTEYIFYVSATGTTSTIAFAGRDVPSAYMLDDVSVNSTSIPEPTTMLLLGLGLVGLAGVRRKFKQ